MDYVKEKRDLLDDAVNALVDTVLSECRRQAMIADSGWRGLLAIEKSRVEKLEAENQTLLDGHRDFRSKIGELEEESKRLKTLNEHLEADKKNLNTWIDNLQSSLNDSNKRINEIGLELDRYKQLQPWCIKKCSGEVNVSMAFGPKLFATREHAEKYRKDISDAKDWESVLWEGEDKFPEPEKAIPGKAWCLKHEFSGMPYRHGFDPVLFPTKVKAEKFKEITELDDNWVASPWE